jgi:hypothetical protein
MTINFEISALEKSNNDLVKHFEIYFTEPISGNWLIDVIHKALLGEEVRQLREIADNSLKNELSHYQE